VASSLNLKAGFDEGLINNIRRDKLTHVQFCAPYFVSLRSVALYLLTAHQAVCSSQTAHLTQSHVTSKDVRRLIIKLINGPTDCHHSTYHYCSVAEKPSLLLSFSGMLVILLLLIIRLFRRRRLLLIRRLLLLLLRLLLRRFLLLRRRLLLFLLLLSVGPAESRLIHCSLPRLIVLTPFFGYPFISRGAPRQTV
jgi:hypothetical protein